VSFIETICFRELFLGDIVRNPYFTSSPIVFRAPMANDQECLQCGRCCERWGWGQRGIPADIVPWLADNRQDILGHVMIWFSDGSRVNGCHVTEADLPRIARVRYWQDTGGRELRYCPFLRRSPDNRAWCGIHDCKPAVCRGFTPWTWQNHEFYGNCPACREKSS
jgi:Fe-S-cluster containining protein